MSYPGFSIRLTLALFAMTFAVPTGFAQNKQQQGQDPTEKPRNVKPELKRAYKDWLEHDVTYIITDEERKAFKYSSGPTRPGSGLAGGWRALPSPSV